MAHRNSPLTLEGKRRLIERLLSGRPIAHVATEMGISRQTATKWWGRYLHYGDDGLQESSSRPLSSPTKTTEDVIDLVVAIRTLKKWGAARIAAYMLSEHGVKISHSTVHRHLVERGLSRVSDLDPATGEIKKRPTYKTMDPKYLGYMVHIDVKKVGRIPDGGGWFIHGQGTDLHRKSKRAGVGKVGYIYIHTAVEAFSRLAYSEVHLNEKGSTAAGHWLRALEFFKQHGINRIENNLTDNGGAYRSKAYNEALESTGTHHRFTPPYTPRVNGKVERFNQTMKNEWLQVQGYDSEDARIEELHRFLNYYNHERPHTAHGMKPPASVAPSDFRLGPQQMVWPETIVPEKHDDNRLFDDILDFMSSEQPHET